MLNFFNHTIFFNLQEIVLFFCILISFLFLSINLILADLLNFFSNFVVLSMSSNNVPFPGPSSIKSNSD